MTVFRCPAGPRPASGTAETAAATLACRGSHGAPRTYVLMESPHSSSHMCSNYIHVSGHPPWTRPGRARAGRRRRRPPGGHRRGRCCGMTEMTAATVNRPGSAIAAGQARRARRSLPGGRRRAATAAARPVAVSSGTRPPTGSGPCTAGHAWPGPQARDEKVRSQFAYSPGSRRLADLQNRPRSSSASSPMLACSLERDCWPRPPREGSGSRRRRTARPRPGRRTMPPKMTLRTAAPQRPQWTRARSRRMPRGRPTRPRTAPRCS